MQATPEEDGDKEEHEFLITLGEHLDLATPEASPWTFQLHVPVHSSFSALASWNWSLPLATQSVLMNQPRSQVCCLPEPWSWEGI